MENKIYTYTEPEKVRPKRDWWPFARFGLVIAICAACLVVAAGGLYLKHQEQLNKQAETINMLLLLEQDDFVHATDKQLDDIAGLKVDAKKNPRVAEAKALALAHAGRYKSALAEFDKIIAAHRTSAYVYRGALVAAQSGDMQRAAKDMKLAIELYKQENPTAAKERPVQLRRMESKLDAFESTPQEKS